MRSALIFVLVVAALAKYDVTGDFKVIASDCDQTQALTVTDFYIGRKVNFKSTDITKWPYNVAAGYDKAGSTKLDMDRVYVFEKAKTTGDLKPHTELFLNTPDCTKNTKENCPAECKVDDAGICNAIKIPYCYQLTQEECKARTDDCVWDDQADPAACTNIERACDYYKDVYSCIIYKSGVCEWKDNKCASKARSSRSARDNKNAHSYICDWESDDKAKCTRQLTVTTPSCSITLEHSGSTKTVIATLTVVVIAVLAVLF